MFSDQFYWGRRVRSLGIGSAMPAAALNDGILGRALEDALQPAVAARAQFVGAKVSHDGAVIAAQRLAEEYG
jgi:UDP:flavonoid glycosyltransferase YjiC (YdhE family)